MKLLKKGGGQKVWGSKKKGREICLRREIELEKGTPSVAPREYKTKVSYSHHSICNRNCSINGQRNSLLLFPIVECLFPVIYLYLNCVGHYSRIPRSVLRGLISVSLHVDLHVNSCSLSFSGDNDFD